MKFTRNALLSSCISLLSACTVSLPDVRVCAVAGQMSAGMDCAYTNSEKTEEMNLDQAVAFLEPQLDPARGAAMCMSSEDFSKLKTAIEQLCKKVGAACSKEAKENIERVSQNVDGLQARVRAKRLKKK